MVRNLNMNLHFSSALADDYHSSSQKIRVETEDWVARNLYCPICGRPKIIHYENNKPVADFYCDKCSSDFELKSKESKSGKLGDKIMDGAYSTMIERITSLRNPNFFFLTYANNLVNNFILVPNAFFVPEIIEKRKPLSETARRAGWIGCNINISQIPEDGKIFVIKDSKEIDHDLVIQKYQQSKTGNIESKGWLMDVLNCIDKIDKQEFELQDVYDFAPSLKLKHPNNNFIEDKIRQKLQILRDKGIIQFVSHGHYRKL
jgi:type II restriction enzyme